MPKNLEYRTLSLLRPTTEKRIQSDYYVEGYATTFDKPYELFEYDGVKYYEMIERTALVGADMSDVIFQYDHSGKVMARNTNNTLIVEPNADGLFIAADLSKSSASKELYEEISSGLITRMSWAFTVSEEGYDRETRTRIIKRIKKVYDVSAVSIPANGDTTISARSWLDSLVESEKREQLEQRKRILKMKLELEGY